MGTPWYLCVLAVALGLEASYAVAWCVDKAMD